MDNLQAALDAPTALNVTVQATRRREVRRSSRPREYLTEREIEKLMDAARGNRWGHRDTTAILLAYRHGLRASELVTLRWDDVDFRTGKLHVRRSKGGQPSVHPIGGRESPRLAPLATRGAAGALCVHLRASGTPERGWLPAHGCARWRGGGLPVSDQQPCAAPLVRLQAGQRWAGHPIDPTLSWPQVDCFDGSLHSARAGSVQGFLERLREKRTSGRERAALCCPRGG